VSVFSNANTVPREEIIQKTDNKMKNPFDTHPDKGYGSRLPACGGIVIRLNACRIPIKAELARIARQGHKNKGALRGSEIKITNAQTGTK
jgi:hypothetical protein